MPIGKASIARAAAQVTPAEKEKKQTRTSASAKKPDPAKIAAELSSKPDPAKIAAELSSLTLLPSGYPEAGVAAELWAAKTEAIGFLAGAAPTAADAAPSALLDSVKAHGILAPLVLARTADGRLWLLDGYRRLDAAKMLGLFRVPATVVEAANENEALRRFEEIAHTRRAAADVREGKFRAAAGMDHDMPAYLL